MSNLIYNEDMTRTFESRYEKVETVNYVGTHSRMPGTGYKDYIYDVNGRFRVTVHANTYDQVKGFCTTYDIEPLNDVIQKKKAFGRRAKYLSKETGMPWEICIQFNAIKDDEEAINLLEVLKERVKDCSIIEPHVWELSHCGINRRVRAIKEIITEEVFDKISCRNQTQTKTMADYLLSLLDAKIKGF